MRTSTSLAALVALALGSAAASRALASGAAAPEPVVAAVADPCRAPLPAADPGCAGEPLCPAEARVKLACELREAMEERYVFFAVKGRLLAANGTPGFDARRHLDACVEAERAVPREDDALRFHDRLRRCAAAFEDGHLMPAVPGGMPEVALGVGLRLAEGRVYVASREVRLFRALAAEHPEAAHLLAPGAEVIAVDGRPVAERLAELAAHLPGSSRAARLERAVDALTRRDFLFPEKRLAAITVVDGDLARTVELPWWIAPGGDRHPLTRERARRAGLASTSLIAWKRAPREAAPADSDGALRADPIVPPAEAAALKPLTGDRGQLAARVGEVARAGAAPFCYAQVLTFHTENLAGPGEEPRSLPDVLRDFFTACEARGRDLVLDLRQDEGGYLSHSSAVAALLLRPGAEAAGGALLLRATARNEAVYAKRAPSASASNAGGTAPAPHARRVLDGLRAARAEGHDFTPSFLEAPLRPPEGAGFSGQVVALVGPSCMSACDRLAGLLRSAGRAVLVGEPTEGAGGSQQETRDLPARWTDAEGRFALAIPNAAMGVQPGRAGGEGGTAAPEAFFREQAFENRPVLPQVPYAPTRRDLVEHNRGWREVVESVLSGPRTPPAPQVAAGPASDLRG